MCTSHRTFASVAACNPSPPCVGWRRLLPEQACEQQSTQHKAAGEIEADRLVIVRLGSTGSGRRRSVARVGQRQDCRAAGFGDGPQPQAWEADVAAATPCYYADDFAAEPQMENGEKWTQTAPQARSSTVRPVAQILSSVTSCYSLTVASCLRRAPPRRDPSAARRA